MGSQQSERGPVQVVEYQHEGLALRSPAQELAHAVEESEARLILIQRWRGPDVGEAIGHLGHDLGDYGRPPAQGG